MARRAVVEVQCSRCERKELREDAIVPNGPTSPALKVTFFQIGVAAPAKSIEFEDLCGPCEGAVLGHLEAIGKKIEGLSPERRKKDS